MKAARLKNRIMPLRSKAIDTYLNQVPEPACSALADLRHLIQLSAPEATETISYQLPAFRHNGALVAFGATTKHCAFYVKSGTVLEPFQHELTGYKTSKGTIRFTPDRPLPAALVRRLVKARIKENDARAKPRGKR